MVVVATTNLISIAGNQLRSAIETTAIDFQHDHAAVGGVVWGEANENARPHTRLSSNWLNNFSTLSVFSDFFVSYSSSLSLPPPFLFFITFCSFSSFLGEECRKSPRGKYNHARKMLWREQQQPVVVVLQNVQLFSFLFCFLMTPAAMGKSTCTHTGYVIIARRDSFFSLLYYGRPIVSPFFARRLVLRSFVRRSRTKIDPLPRDFFFFLFRSRTQKDKADNK